MIRHIVSWKLHDGDEQQKAQAFAEISAALMPLGDRLAGISQFTVSRNVVDQPSNFDVVLVADFATLGDLDAYQVHPEHVAATAIVRSHVAARACVDVEV